MKRLVLLALSLMAIVALWPSAASAHNSLDSSTPADGATLRTAPDQITFVFANPVPLDTLTVTLTAPSGVRTDLPGSRHGAGGEQEVVTPLPPLEDGTSSVRWRLVSSDGHAITGRVEMTLEAAGSTTTSPAGAGSTPDTVSPRPPATVASESASADDDEPGGVPDPVRWLLRYASYLAIMVLAGLVVTEALVWGAVLTVPRVRTVAGGALLAIGVLAVLQLLVIAADISGSGVLSSWGDVDSALQTHAGVALLTRVALAFAAWVVIVRARPSSEVVYSDALLILAVGLLGTWSFGGHSRSMRWPLVGVPLDVVHHGAAAAWVGGLLVVTFVAMPHLTAPELRPVLQRFSRLAAWAVGLIVATGVIQTVRLVGSPFDLLADTHGRLVVVKVVGLGVMLVLANANRTRVNSRLTFEPDQGAAQLGAMRTAMRAELVVGLVVIAATAGLVVSPPTTADEAGQSTPSAATSGR